MVMITCVEDRDGTMFNNRRLSMDSVVYRKILELASGKNLWTDAGAGRLFRETGMAAAAGVLEDADFLNKAEDGDFCFVEGQDMADVRDRLEGIVLFYWNRKYPADRYFDRSLLEGFRLKRREEFPGSSHEKLTMEVYER